MKKTLLRPVWSLCAMLMASALLSSCSSADARNEHKPDDKIGSTGTVTFTYRGKQVTYATVKAKDDRIWLQQNLGAAHVATSPDDIAAQGDLFQWGRWDDGHQYRYSDTVFTKDVQPNNPAGLKGGLNKFVVYRGQYGNRHKEINSPDAWYMNGKVTDQWTAATPAEATESNGCDPCKAIGPDWRLPTEEEWQNLCAIENIHKNDDQGFASNLKLIGAGSRHAEANLDHNLIESRTGRSMTLWYWSSTPNPKMGYCGLPMETDNYDDQGTYRGTGMSIRCIKALKK